MTDVWCLLIDHDSLPVGPQFSVRVGADDNISTLREKIRRGWANTLAGVSPSSLRVYKCTDTTIDFDNQDSDALKKEIQAAFENGECTYLGLTRVGGKLQWEPVDVTDEETLLVRIPRTCRFPPITYRVELQAKLPAAETRKRKERESTEEQEPVEVQRLRKETTNKSPSVLASPSKFRKITGSQHSIACNRPFKPHTVPIALLDESFGRFLDRRSRPPSPGTIRFLLKLTELACDWCSEEDHRTSALRNLFVTDAKLDFAPSAVRDNVTDGNLPVIVMPASILECNNECGYGKERAALFYCQFLTRAWDQGYLGGGTRFPCILIVSTGPFLAFYGALWNGEQATVEPLTPMFDLTTHLGDKEQRAATASALDAALETIARIQKHYNDIVNVRQTTAAEGVNEARKYPYKTSYSECGQSLTFTYDTRPDDTKLVFYATPNTPQSVNDQLVVKFTHQYGEEVHRYLAENELAPRLREVSVIPGGWRHVVMDKSHYGPLDEMFSLTQKESEKVAHALRRAAELLHRAGFVHGDMRAANVLVDRSSLSGDDDVRIHLIDFDWAGREGEVRYPLDINRETMWRPKGAVGGELITQEHDIEMITLRFHSS